MIRCDSIYRCHYSPSAVPYVIIRKYNLACAQRFPPASQNQIWLFNISGKEERIKRNENILKQQIEYFPSTAPYTRKAQALKIYIPQITRAHTTRNNATFLQSRPQIAAEETLKNRPHGNHLNLINKSQAATRMRNIAEPFNPVNQQQAGIHTKLGRG